MPAFSDCDTVLSFSGTGKKTLWDIWRFVPNLTALISLFVRLSQTLQEVTDDNMDRCSEFICMAQLYFIQPTAKRRMIAIMQATRKLVTSAELNYTKLRYERLPFIRDIIKTIKSSHGLESNSDTAQDQESAECGRWLLTSEKSAQNFEQI